MPHTPFFLRATAALAGVVFAIVLMGGGAFAASPFEGKWNVQDTKGNPFEIRCPMTARLRAIVPAKACPVPGKPKATPR